jgi:alpha-L-arabinofuranosidase
MVLSYLTSFNTMILGGCYVEGERLWNAFRWTASIGPWEERPGHFGDVWNYWSDDGLGYFEFLQVIENLLVSHFLPNHS